MNAPNRTPRALGAEAAIKGLPEQSNPYREPALRRLGWGALKPEEADRRWKMMEEALDRAGLGPMLRIRFADFVEWRTAYWQQRHGPYEARESDRGPLEIERSGNLDLARYSDDEGTPELRQHAEIVNSEVREGGETRKRPRTVDAIRRLRLAKEMTAKQEWACRRFHADFQEAQLDPERVPDPGRVTGLGGGPESERVLDAKDRVGSAMKALGGHGSACGSAAWFVVGMGLNVSQWIPKARFTGSRSENFKLARTILAGTAQALEAHYDQEDRR